MKKMNKKEKRESRINISSFFIGCGATLIICILVVLCLNKKEVENSSLKESIKKVEKSVVTIESYKGLALESTGTGFIYEKKGSSAYILTNEHVTVEDTVLVTNSKNEETKGKVLGKDAYLDIAVIEIDKKFAEGVATIKSSEKTEVGDTIFVVGSPVSKRYAGSVSAGILSGKNRIVQTLIEDDNTSEWLMNVLQFDASVNPGNSGGPLLNEKGEVIGICTMKLIQQEIEGMAFAIPIETAMKHVETLKEGKEITWPELGISMVDITNTQQLLNHNIDIDEDRIDGVVVLDTKENSSADKKLKKGDIILEIDGMNIKDTSYVKYSLFQHKVGDKIKIKIIRNHKEKEIKVILKNAS